MTAPSSYARILAHHPYIVIGVIFVVVATCLIVSTVVGEMPKFNDPTAGFTARGTEISNRMIAYRNLINNADSEITLMATVYDEKKNIVNRAKKRRRKKKPRKKNRSNRRKKQRRKWKNINSNVTQIVEDIGQDLVNDDDSDDDDDDDDDDRSTPSSPKDVCAPIPDKQYARVVFGSINGTSLFTVDNIRDMCHLEQQLLISYKNYTQLCHRRNEQCCLPWSIGQIVASLNNKSECMDICEEDVTFVRHLLTICLEPYNNGYLMPECYSNECLNVSSVCTDKSTVYLLSHYLMDSHYNATTNHLSYAMTFIPMAGGLSAIDFYKHIESQPLVANNVRIVGAQLNNKFLLFDEYLLTDSVWLLAAGAIIFLTIWFYSSSLFVTCMTFLAMFWSLEIAYFLYKFVFEIEFFPYMNLMTVIIIIGVGADDVLIFCKVWYMAKSEKNNGTLEKIVSDTLRHSTLTMLVTSLTTAAAFYANYISDVTAIKCFSLYAGTTMLANYIFMITWLPAAVIIYEKWCNCCFCYNLDFYAPKCKLYNYICKLPFNGYYFTYNHARHFIEKLLPCVIIRLQFFWLITLSSVTIASVIAIFYYPKLKLPSSKEFQVFSGKHLMEMYDLELSRHFEFERSTYNMPITLVWGVNADDNGVHLEPHDFGKLSLSDSFSLYDGDSQLWLVKFCKKLRKSKFYLATPGLQISNCFMENFKLYMNKPCDTDGVSKCCESTPFPYTESIMVECLNEYIPRLMASNMLMYTRQSPGPRFHQGRLRALIVEFTSNVPFSHQYENISRFYEGMNTFMENELLTAPDGLKQGWFVSDLAFYDLQHTLVTGVPVAIGVSMAIAGLVAFLTTLNILISVYAILTVVSIVHITVASLVLLGWHLNILEAIIITVTIGMSFDYTLHYGVAYRLSPDLSREMRVISSLRHMGSPVTMAAITTFLAGLLMLPSTVNVYRQFGVFLMINVTISWIYSTMFFHSLLSFIGPQSAFGQLHWPSLECCGGSSREHIDKTIYTMSESTVSSTTSTSNPHHGGAGESHELEPLTHQNHLTVYHHRHRQPCRLHYYNSHVESSNVSTNVSDGQEVYSPSNPCDSPIMTPKTRLASIVTFDAVTSADDSDSDKVPPSLHNSNGKTNSNNSELDGNVCIAQVY